METKSEKIKLSENQERAVSADPRVDRIVIAMAGSGKTTVLTEYYLALLETGLNPEEIVAITFTEKAARSMRVKLDKKLNETDRDDVAEELNSSTISTIHSFFGRLVRENALVLGLDPDSTIIDESRAEILRQECLNEVMVKFKEESRDRYDLLLTRLEWGNDPETSFLRFFNNMKSLGFSAGELHGGPDEVTVFERARENLQAEIDGFIVISKTFTKLSEPQHNKIVCLHELDEIVNSLGIDDLTYLKSEQISAYTKRGKISGTFTKAVKEDFDLLKNSIKDFVDSLYYVLGKEVREIFLKLISDFESQYRSAKQKSHVLDYNDLEFHSLDLFENHPHILKKIKARFTAFLIDEFQDTNPLQMKLIEKLRPSKGFFAVGDPRQSIYGFRYADIRIMLNEIGKFESGSGEVIKLDENYRSRKMLLECISGMFDQRQIDNNFSDMKFGRFIPGRKFKTEGVKNSVEVIVSVADISEEAKELEVLAVANRLAGLLNSGMKIEGKDGESRVLTPGDCAVLFRTKSRMRKFARAFESAGIPHQISTGGGFYNQREVMDLINYLELLMNPYNVLTFGEVIRAPFYGISMDGLFTLISKLKTHREGELFEENFWENNKINLSGSDSMRFEDFQAEFEMILNESDGISVADRLLLILDKTHFKGATAVGRGGRRRLGNIDKLMNLADDWESDFPGNISGFIDRIKELRFRDVMEPESPVDSTDDSVSLMTIHAAKGLEFPLVILADATAQVSKRKAQWLISADGQIVLKARNAAENQYKSVEDVFYKNLTGEIREKEMSEAFRLIYVALTRASEKLIISVPLTQSPQGEFWDFFNGVFDLKPMRDEIPDSMEIGEVKIPFYQASELSTRKEIYSHMPLKDDLSFDLDTIFNQVGSWPREFKHKRSFYSVSEFSTWLQCPLKYKFNYEMGFSKLVERFGNMNMKTADEESDVDFNHDDYPDAPKIKPQYRGTIIHNLLSDMVDKKDNFSIDEFLNKNITDGSIISRDELLVIADRFRSSDIGVSLMRSKINFIEN